MNLSDIKECDLAYSSLVQFHSFINCGCNVAIFPNGKIGTIVNENFIIGKITKFGYDSDFDSKNVASYEVVEIDSYNKTCWLEKVK